MRRSDKEITDSKLIEDILQRSRVCHIATTSDTHYPYLFTVNYGFRDNKIYFHSAPEGKKIELIKQDPWVCFQVVTDIQMITGENPCKDWSMNYKSVTGYGWAGVVSDPKEKIEGLNILMEHYTNKGPFTFTEKNLEETAVVRIVIDKMTAKGS